MSRANDAEVAKWLEAVLSADETDMADETREAEDCCLVSWATVDFEVTCP